MATQYLTAEDLSFTAAPMFEDGTELDMPNYSSEFLPPERSPLPYIDFHEYSGQTNNIAPSALIKSPCYNSPITPGSTHNSADGVSEDWFSTKRTVSTGTTSPDAAQADAGKEDQTWFRNYINLPADEPEAPSEGMSLAATAGSCVNSDREPPEALPATTTGLAITTHPVREQMDSF
jgi:hypothetical protein